MIHVNRLSLDKLVDSFRNKKGKNKIVISLWFLYHKHRVIQFSEHKPFVLMRSDPVFFPNLAETSNINKNSQKTR